MGDKAIEFNVKSVAKYCKVNLSVEFKGHIIEIAASQRRGRKFVMLTCEPDGHLAWIPVSKIDMSTDDVEDFILNWIMSDEGTSFIKSIVERG